WLKITLHLTFWQQYDPEGRKNRGLLSLMRRHHWKLTAMQKENLHRYLAQEPVLRALYFAKQQLNGFLVMKSLKRKRAQKMMPQFLALIEQFEQSPASALAQTLRSWLEPIVRMWRFTKSNGITEGFHTKMEMLSRRAYGLYIIKGGRSTFARLVFAKNSSNGSNADVPNRFYPRDSWAGGPRSKASQRYSCMGWAA